MAVRVARFNGECRGNCGRRIFKGEKIVHRGSFHNWHMECWNEQKTVAVDPGNAAEYALARREIARDNSEYQKGIRDYENWKFNQQIFGEEEAERMEIERELKEGWDY